MSRIHRARLACAALLLFCPLAAYADSLTIDLQTARLRAREHAPDAIAAHALIQRARAAGAGARMRFEENLDISAGAGVRYGEPRSTAAEVRLAQPLELGRRSARIAVADAGERQARAETEQALRELDLAVTLAFNTAKHADLALEIATLSETLTTRSVAAAERRHRAGELSDLDLDLAKIALGRAHASVANARSMRATAIGTLGALIGAKPGDTIALQGSLAPAPLSLEALRTTLRTRPDLRQLDAEAGVARAEADLARARRLPAVGLWVGYTRDEFDNIVLGGVNLTLPLWNREQGNLASAHAKETSAQLRRAATAAAAARELEDAFEAYSHERAAVDTMLREVVPVIDDVQTLLDKSIAAGQVTVGELLVIRQEVTTARRELADRELELANAAARVRYIAGVTP